MAGHSLAPAARAPTVAPGPTRTPAAPQTCAPGDVAQSPGSDLGLGSGTPRSYTVKPGDNLSSIALAELGGRQHWRRIYSDNANIIGDDPGSIHPGWVLLLYPALPTLSGGGDVSLPLPIELQQTVDPAAMSLAQVMERIESCQAVVDSARSYQAAHAATVAEEMRALDVHYRGRIAFDEAGAGSASACSPADQLVLPPKLVDGMQTGWDGSLPGGASQEQGGILVRNPDGSFDWKAGAPGGSGMFSPNYGDMDADESLIGVGHTHPYSASEGGHTDVSFSGQDLARLALVADNVAVVQSGATTFVATRTQEFDALTAGLDLAGKQTLFQEISDS